MFQHPYWRQALLALALTALTAGPAAARGIEEERETLNESIVVLESLVKGPDAEIPDQILKRAEAILIIPKLAKGGLIVGAERGTGVFSVKDHATGAWGAPSFMTLTGGSIGWQLGFTSVDMVLLVMNRDAIDDLLDSEFTLGANASVAVGPVGRSAELSTDATLTAQILAYSRAKGLFAGLAIKGATLEDDQDANASFYGKPVSAKQVIATPNAVTVPPEIESWRKRLGVAVASAQP
jgi:lipid-binding SYLF domain-containing protein